MQKLYIVKSENYLSQLKANVEYTWFLHERRTPVLPYELVIQGYKEFVQAERAELPGEQSRSSAPKKPGSRKAREAVDALFTLEEATKLQAFLIKTFSGMNVSIEEVNLPIPIDTKLSSLYEKLNFNGDYVDPQDFAGLEGNDLDFKVTAFVSYRPRYVAEDFLKNLSPARLAALRKMHAENDG